MSDKVVQTSPHGVSLFLSLRRNKEVPMCTKDTLVLTLKLFGLATLVYLVFTFGIEPLRTHLTAPSAAPSAPTTPTAPRTPSHTPVWWDGGEEYDVHAPRKAPLSRGFSFCTQCARLELCVDRRLEGRVIIRA